MGKIIISKSSKKIEQKKIDTKSKISDIQNERVKRSNNKIVGYTNWIKEEHIKQRAVGSRSEGQIKRAEFTFYHSADDLLPLNYVTLYML